MNPHPLARLHRPTLVSWVVPEGAWGRRTNINPAGHKLTLARTVVDDEPANVFFVQQREGGAPTYLYDADTRIRYLVCGPDVTEVLLQFSFCADHGFVELGYTTELAEPRQIHPIFRWFNNREIGV